MTRQVQRWRAQAACRTRLDLDFIDPTPVEAGRCRAVCAACLVREHCLAEALAASEPWGIWGGLDTDQRAGLAEQDGRPEPAILPAHGTNTRYAKHGCRCPACRSAHTTHERHRRARRRQPGVERAPKLHASTARDGEHPKMAFAHLGTDLDHRAGHPHCAGDG